MHVRIWQSTSATLSRPRSRLLSKFLSARDGGAAVEFALIVPVMLVLALGAIEVREAVSADRKLNILANSVGDVVARTPVLRESDLADLFTIAENLMGRYGAGAVGLTVTAANIGQDTGATVAWSRAHNGDETQLASPHNDAEINRLIAQDIRSSGQIASNEQQLIAVEIEMTYVPLTGFIGLNLLRDQASQIMQLALSDQAVFVPRRANRTFLCPDSWEPGDPTAECEG